MPSGPKGEKRPADSLRNSIMVAKIANGEIEDITTKHGKRGSCRKQAYQISTRGMARWPRALSADPAHAHTTSDVLMPKKGLKCPSEIGRISNAGHRRSFELTC
jgi:hypothetical protein